MQLVDLAARVLDAAIHLQAFRGADEAAAEDQEAPLIATGIIHGRLGAPIHAGRVLDLAVDGGKLAAAAAAAGAGQFLLQLHAAHLLVVLRQRVAGAGERRAANREQRQARRTADTLRQGGEPRLVRHFHVNVRQLGSQQAMRAPGHEPKGIWL